LILENLLKPVLVYTLDIQTVRPGGLPRCAAEPESRLLRIRRKRFRRMLAAAQAGEIKILFNSFSDRIWTFI
jgi:hypothetical protein